jgi:hypothetical protein
MDDLSRFYHFDPASFLIGAYRIAETYQRALPGAASCTCGDNLTRKYLIAGSEQSFNVWTSKKQLLFTTSNSEGSQYHRD